MYNGSFSVEPENGHQPPRNGWFATENDQGSQIAPSQKKAPKNPMVDHHVPIKIVTSGYSPLLDKPIFVIVKSHFQPCNLKIDFT